MNIIEILKNKICNRMDYKKPCELRVSEKYFTEWLDEQPNYGMCNPPMSAQMALDYLFDYLDIAPISISQNAEQCNTEVVYEILWRYSPNFRKEVERWRNSKQN